MPYRSLTTKELARMLGADARRLERMAERGEIPCQKVGGQLRFNRAEITEWLQQNMARMERDHLDEMDAGITAQRQVREDEPIVTPLLRVEAVSPQLGSRSKASTLRELVTLASNTGLVYDDRALLEAVQAREELCSTALEGGIAIPHPRRPLPYDLADSVLVVARTSRGTVFGALDGKLTDLFFLMAAQDDHHHLHILARLCRMLHDDNWVAQLRTAETAEAMIESIKERERELLGR
ncbi:MAG: PTS sugar transporter subunit IIA [Phycisphaerales bacterium]|nr:MAG: PTS sugar transporter subunit IIA [Phycisphaerales bacterium]